ncbi:MAG: hypothetical protein K5870_00880 [Lachnospiraceae bacterium]|nr:hypothetical protein [Lachnospiraceae bacterium]
MRCPKCGYENQKVKDSRPRSKGWTRVRECFNCKFKFRTIERYSYDTLQEIPSHRLSSKNERNLHNIKRIKDLAKKMNIKLEKEQTE